MYRVLAALTRDMNEGWVWLSNAGLESRSIVTIKNKANNKMIYCECLEIDENFTREYNASRTNSIKANENVIVMNEWYRKQLGGIVTNREHDLEIRSADNFYGKIRANTGHPQVVVRLATCLALLSLALGLISILLSIKSCVENKTMGQKDSMAIIVERSSFNINGITTVQRESSLSFQKL